MWSNTDNGQLEGCAQIQIKVYWKDVIKYRWRSTRKMWSNTDKGQLARCDQIQIKVN